MKSVEDSFRICRVKPNQHEQRRTDCLNTSRSKWKGTIYMDEIAFICHKMKHTTTYHTIQLDKIEELLYHHYCSVHMCLHQHKQLPI